MLLITYIFSVVLLNLTPHYTDGTITIEQSVHIYVYLIMQLRR